MSDYRWIQLETKHGYAAVPIDEISYFISRGGCKGSAVFVKGRDTPIKTEDKPGRIERLIKKAEGIYVAETNYSNSEVSK